MLDIHAAALSEKIASYHEFLLRYSKTKKIVYGFVEGKEDPSFYRGFIENHIPDDWEVELWPAGNKEQVYRIHVDMDWRRFSKKRICFFVDRDLSDLLHIRLDEDINMYVTDNYSIENAIVNTGCFRRVITEICGFWEVKHDELDSVCRMFEEELEKFLVALVPIMSWILVWRRAGIKAGLNDILMRDLFAIKEGRLQSRESPKGYRDASEYIHGQCNIERDPAVDIQTHMKELADHLRYRRLTRGKYLLWFIVEFCLSIRSCAKTLFPSCGRTPTMKVTFSFANAITMIGNRARIPQSLRVFLEETFCSYIASRPQN